MSGDVQESAEEVVNVRRQWNDRRIAKYRLSDVRNPHWRDSSGGVRVRSPRPMIYLRVLCDRMIDGELAHSCAHGEGPHDILVCVTKKDNSKRVYSKLVALADLGE